MQDQTPVTLPVPESKLESLVTGTLSEQFDYSYEKEIQIKLSQQYMINYL